MGLNLEQITGRLARFRSRIQDGTKDVSLCPSKNERE
jgi:hypothetical protein